MTPSPPHSRFRPLMEVAVELTGLLLTLTTVLSLHQVFSGSAWVWPVGGAGIAAHLLVVIVRRLGLGILTSAILSGAGLVLALTWTHYWDTIFWLLPSGDTFSELADDLNRAWTEFGDVSPPVAPLDGFVVSAMAAVWIVAFITDWSSLRLSTATEALILPIAAVSFVGVVGDDQQRTLTIMAFVAALLLFVTAHRVALITSETTWIAHRAATGRRVMLVGGTLIATASLVGVLIAGPALARDQSPILDFERRETTSSGRVVLSPLVDIRGRLVNQTDTVMFTVQSDQRSYWRLTSLDQFDGAVWSSLANYPETPLELPSLVQSGTSTENSIQEFSIEGLAAVWLPAAFEPRRLESETSDIRYEPSSSTLIVGRSLDNSDGITYTVESAVPRFDPTELQQTSPDNESDPELASYLELPADFSPRIQQTAASVVSGVESDYEKALALQAFFRDGSFTYDTNVAAGHSNNHIESFLDTRRGYCEQFAGTFAAMARSVGLPSRVAVGFTVGDSDPDNPDSYRVRGEHAHAWPEVFLSGAGWVAFEPTPGRGAPGALNYTGVAESQDTSGPSIPLAEDPVVDPLETLEPSGLSDEFLFPDLLDAENPLATTRENQNPTGLSGQTWIIIGAVVATGLLGFAIPFLKRSQRLRHYRLATNHRKRIQLLWSDAVNDLAVMGIAPRPHETHAEFAHRAAHKLPPLNPDLDRLGELAAATVFARDEPTDHDQWMARAWSMSVRSQARFQVRKWRALIAAIDPRPLWSGFRLFSSSGRLGHPDASDHESGGRET